MFDGECLCPDCSVPLLDDIECPCCGRFWKEKELMKTNTPVDLPGDIAERLEIQNPPCPSLARGNPGIDYGLGRENIDHETGIRYGVIPAIAVHYWAEESEAEYGEPTCSKCGGSAQIIDPAPIDNNNDFHCMDCEYTFNLDEAYPDSPIGYSYNQGKLQASQSGDDADIFITKSPYYTHAQFCSPCVPGAGHLGNPMTGGVKTYCFGHDWFDGRAPYPVYCVADDTSVLS